MSEDESSENKSCADSAGHSVASDSFSTNKATHVDGEIQGESQLTECCDDTVLFAMRDNYHEFSIGLTTILECLRFAEREGHTPALPSDWWLSVGSRYGVR